MRFISGLAVPRQVEFPGFGHHVALSRAPRDSQLDIRPDQSAFKNMFFKLQGIHSFILMKRQVTQ